MKTKTLLPFVALFAALAGMTGAQSSHTVAELQPIFPNSTLRQIAGQNQLLVSIFKQAETMPGANIGQLAIAESYFQGRADIVNQLADALDTVTP